MDEKSSSEDIKRLSDRVAEVMGRPFRGKIEVVTDTTDSINIRRGAVITMQGREFFVLGDVLEPRFGLDEQPKYWVKKCYDLGDGSVKILKLVFHEEFLAHVGPLRIRCFRDPRKESRVLDLVQGDTRFMQGETLVDGKENEVRVIDYIYGNRMYDWLLDLEVGHEEYFHTILPGMLPHILICMEAIRKLHAHSLCHGDIRNDHIIIERETGQYRWIDFDLTQHYPDFDVWSLGNIIMFVVGRGPRSFHEVRNSKKFSDQVKASLTKKDASAFYIYRIMTLGKIYPYIPEKMNKLLSHFSVGAESYYETLDPLIDDFVDAIEQFPKG
jgi:hypothetical protein